MKKIDAMHHYYGYGLGVCGNCPHFFRKTYDRTYLKCSVYGNSNSEATDWKAGYSACGLIDKPFPADETRIITRVAREKKDLGQLPGQLMMDFSR